MTNMRMLKQISRHTIMYQFRNNCINEKVGVALIKEKMTKVRLRWFEHVQIRSLGTPLRKVDQMDFNPMRRERGKHKKKKKN